MEKIHLESALEHIKNAQDEEQMYLLSSATKLIQAELDSMTRPKLEVVDIYSGKNPSAFRGSLCDEFQNQYWELCQERLKHIGGRIIDHTTLNEPLDREGYYNLRTNANGIPLRVVFSSMSRPYVLRLMLHGGALFRMVLSGDQYKPLEDKIYAIIHGDGIKKDMDKITESFANKMLEEAGPVIAKLIDKDGRVIYPLRYHFVSGSWHIVFYDQAYRYSKSISTL